MYRTHTETCWHCSLWLYHNWLYHNSCMQLPSLWDMLRAVPECEDVLGMKAFLCVVWEVECGLVCGNVRLWRPGRAPSQQGRATARRERKQHRAVCGTEISSLALLRWERFQLSPAVPRPMHTWGQPGDIANGTGLAPPGWRGFAYQFTAGIK